MIRNRTEESINMRHGTLYRLSVLLLLTTFTCLRNAQAQSSLFVDPAPPKVQTVSPIPALKPQKQAELTFHTAPKPLAAGAVTNEWRTFLGPTYNGVSTETPLLKSFDKKTPTILWEVKKGEGYASPAVVGDSVILFHRLGNEEIIERLNAENGQRFWKFAYLTSYSDRYGFDGGPRCQPVSDGVRVYAYGAGGALHCLDFATGQVLWSRDIAREFKTPQDFFGVGATPLIEDDKLIINVGAPGGPCVAGFDVKTGRLLWGAGKEWGPSYAAPVPATIHGKRRVFVFAGGESRPSTGGLLCIDPANGKIDFAFPHRARRYESVNASAPLIIGNQVFISECYGPGGALLEIAPDFTVRKVWSSEALQTHFMTAVHKDGYLYGVDGHGPSNAPLVCIDLKTGKEMWRTEPDWQETLTTTDGERTASLSSALASMTLVDGRCLLLGYYGHLAWLDLNPRSYKELSRTLLFFAPQTWSHPALSRGLLYVCQNERGLDNSRPRLICYDLRGGAANPDKPK